MAKLCMEDLEQGKTVYTNFHLNLKSIDKKYHKQIKLLDNVFFENYKNFQLYDCSVYIDEAYIFFDSRMSQSKKNRIFSYFVCQTRKRTVNLVMSCQLFRSIDVRVRNQIELFIYPSCVKCDEGTIVRNDIYDANMHKKGKMIFKGDDYFNAYNTEEIIDFTEENEKSK